MISWAVATRRPSQLESMVTISANLVNGVTIVIGESGAYPWADLTLQNQSLHLHAASLADVKM